MVRPVVHDPLVLSKPSVPATAMDMQVVQDLMDTLSANAEHCVGMAANMIGVHKRILVFSAGPFNVAMINPVMVKKSGPYEAEEGCLSLPGVRKTTRYKTIEVEYYDISFRKRKETFRDFTAQIIQHEMDHFEGKLI
ncbi:MAG: peptide deformylase [Clostridia bacterium]|nr:peptide deformylase [Clostridia bacterium]